MAKAPILVIAGLGSGLGGALAGFFAKKGFTVLGLNRSPSQPSSAVSREFLLDLADEAQVMRTAAEIAYQYGTPGVVIHNTAELVIAPFEETSTDQFERCWRSTTLSAFLLAQAFLPKMKEKGGSFIVSGATASLRGGANFSAFSPAKFALRGLTQSLARGYQKHGVHVAHVILDGIIDTPRSRQLHQMDPARMMDPDHIAACYWDLVNQPRSSWTHELDLRPFQENF